MRKIKISTLKKGDWVIFKPLNLLNKRGKIEVARVKEFKVEFDKIHKIDFKGKKYNEESGYVDFIPNFHTLNKLNKKDLKEINFLITKLKTIKALEDENKIKSR